MEKPKHHSLESAALDTLDKDNSLTRAEASQLAHDAHMVGGFVAAAEMTANIQTTGSTEALTIQSPIPNDLLDPRKVYTDLAKGFDTELSVDPVLAYNQGLIDRDNQVLAAITDENSVGDRELKSALIEIINNGVGLDAFSGGQDHPLEGMQVPPFLQSLKDNLTYRDSMTGEPVKGDGTWAGFMRLASPTQKLNLLQWYKTELDKVSDPEQRREQDRLRKRIYTEGISQLAEDGILSPRTAARAESVLENTDIYYKSPFIAFGRSSTVAYHVDGSVVAYVGAKQEHLNHEFTHAIESFTSRDLLNTCLDVKNGHSDVDVAIASSDTVMKMFQEAGAVHMQHMLENLDEPNPGLMVRELRPEGAVHEGLTEEYAQYLDVVSQLLEGPDGNGVVGAPRIREFYAAMTLGKAKDLRKMLFNIWGEDILVDITRASYYALLLSKSEGATVNQFRREVDVSEQKRLVAEQTLSALEKYRQSSRLDTAAA